jgi:hypothetical protein
MTFGVVSSEEKTVNPRVVRGGSFDIDSDIHSFEDRSIRFKE